MKLSHLFLTLLFFSFFTTDILGQTAGASSAESSQSATLKKKSFRPTKGQIQTAQEKLKAAGKFSGGATGRYSKEFRAALRNYQSENSIPETGKLDKATLQKMEIGLTDRQLGIEKPRKAKRKVFRVSKEQITAAQRKLKDSGLYQGDITGKYSKDFRSAVREFQSANGLKRKGALNRATLEKMKIPLSETQKAMPVNPNDLASAKEGKKRGPVFRATRDQITSVQEMLATKNLYSGEATGKLNPDTRKAIRAWQKDNGVKVTGTLNKVTLEAMGIALTARQKTS